MLCAGVIEMARKMMPPSKAAAMAVLYDSCITSLCMVVINILDGATKEKVPV